MSELSTKNLKYSYLQHAYLHMYTYNYHFAVMQNSATFFFKANTLQNAQNKVFPTSFPANF